MANNQGWGSGVGLENGSGALYLKQIEILKVYWMNILDNIKIILFCFHTFGVRRTIDVLDSENQPGSVQIRTGSGALGLTGDVWHQKYENQND